jgi:hypothetical protein
VCQQEEDCQMMRWTAYWQLPAFAEGSREARGTICRHFILFVLILNTLKKQFASRACRCDEILIQTIRYIGIGTE